MLGQGLHAEREVQLSRLLNAFDSLHLRDLAQVLGNCRISVQAAKLFGIQQA